MDDLIVTNIDIQHLAGTWIIIMLSAALLCFLVSEITRNYSQVDKLSSLLPVMYSMVTLSSFPARRIWISFYLDIQCRQILKNDTIK